MNSILSLKDLPSLEVHCNWDSNIPEKSIHDAIFLNHDEKDGETENLNEIVNVKTTVSFVPSEKQPNKPVIHFKIPSAESLFISSITFLCDSRTVEVFGDHTIYLDTVNGTTIEETDEFFVYEYKIDLSKKVNKEVSLKFIKLARPNCLWIYGVLLKLKKINHSPNVSINYDNVQELLKNSHISDQASRAFSFLKDASLSPRFPGNGLGDGSFSKSSDNVQMQNNEIKAYIDYKFQILTDYFIVRDKNISEKLDHILDMIQLKK